MYKLFLLIGCYLLINICSCKNISVHKAKGDLDKNLTDSVTHLYNQGKNLEVISLCTDLINNKDENPLYRILRACAYQRMGKITNCLEDESYIISYIPDTVIIEFDGEKVYCLRWAHFNRGANLIQLNNYEEALADFSRLLQLTKRNPPALSEMATCYLRMGNVKIADSLVAIAYQMDSSSVIVMGNVGIVALQEGDWETAIVYLNKALSKGGEDADYIMSRGVAYRYEKKYELAERDFKKAIELDPYNMHTYSFYAGMLKELGRKQEYCENLHKAIALGKKFDSKILEECK